MHSPSAQILGALSALALIGTVGFAPVPATPTDADGAPFAANDGTFAYQVTPDPAGVLCTTTPGTAAIRTAGSATATGMARGSRTADLTMPAVYHDQVSGLDYCVDAIAPGAFHGNWQLRGGFSIGFAVTRIGLDAFGANPNLRAITVPGDALPDWDHAVVDGVEHTSFGEAGRPTDGPEILIDRGAAIAARDADPASDAHLAYLALQETKRLRHTAWVGQLDSIARPAHVTPQATHGTIRQDEDHTGLRYLYTPGAGAIEADGQTVTFSVDLGFHGMRVQDADGRAIGLSGEPITLTRQFPTFDGTIVGYDDTRTDFTIRIADGREPWSEWAPDTARIAGTSRYGTSAEVLFRTMGQNRPLVLVTGEGFADGLSASALADAVDGDIALVSRDATANRALERVVATRGPSQIIAIGGRSVLPDAIVAAIADAAGTKSVERISGSDRYLTSRMIAQRVLEIDEGAATASDPADRKRAVVLARGDHFADGMAAAGLAGAHDAPVVLLPPASRSLPDTLVADLREHGIDTAFILGGSLVFGRPLQDALEGAGVAWHQLDGTDRYETAALALDHIDVTHAFVTSGEAFADALAVSGLAARDGAAIVLSAKDCLPAASRDALEREQVTSLEMVGGTLVLGKGVDALTVCP